MYSVAFPGRWHEHSRKPDDISVFFHIIDMLYILSILLNDDAMHHGMAGNDSIQANLRRRSMVSGNRV